MTQREALNTIHAALMSGEQFGTVHRSTPPRRTRPAARKE